MADTARSAALLQTPLHELHRELGAKMVEFAGYSMPVSYPVGILAEHRHCRTAAALFDVSHMGQISLRGEGAAAALEALVPVDVIDLADGKQRYALFTDDHAGILDDLMITRRDDDLFLVVNASNKDADLALLRAGLGGATAIEPMFERGLLALQGPQAAAVVARLAPALAQLSFMSGAAARIAGIDVYATRSGYSGEDGFEISVAAADAQALARALLAEPEVAAAGLGARDTLRLEAGLCLHGHDIGATTTPIEAGLAWAIQKVRRPGGARAGGYPGAAKIAAQLADGPERKRVGLIGSERAPAREGAALTTTDGAPVGTVTSGTISPTLQVPIAMAYVDMAHVAEGTSLRASVRGNALPLRVARMPFVAHRYHRG